MIAIGVLIAEFPGDPVQSAEEHRGDCGEAEQTVCRLEDHADQSQGKVSQPVRLAGYPAPALRFFGIVLLFCCSCWF